MSATIVHIHLQTRTHTRHTCTNSHIKCTGMCVRAYQFFSSLSLSLSLSLFLSFSFCLFTHKQVYVCAYLHAYIYIYVCVYTCICMYVDIHICLCICIHSNIYICTLYVYIYVWNPACKTLQLCRPINATVHAIYVWIHIYMYTYKYIYACIYTYIYCVLTLTLNAAGLQPPPYVPRRYVCVCKRQFDVNFIVLINSKYLTIFGLQSHAAISISWKTDKYAKKMSAFPSVHLSCRRTSHI